MRRNAISLLELLVAIAIIAIVMGLLASAIQKVRTAANLSSSQNNLRQQILAMYQWADRDPENYLPGWNNTHQFLVANWPPGLPIGGGGIRSEAKRTDFPPLNAVRVILDSHYWENTYSDLPANRNYSTKRVPYLLSSTDPSLYFSVERPGYEYDLWAPASYAVNMRGFIGPPKLLSSYPDGTSSTIAIAEHHFAQWQDSELLLNIKKRLDYNKATPCHHPESPGKRRTTFADEGCDDVLPISINGKTAPSVPGKTFQVRPSIREIDMRIPSTQFSGLPAAMFDGSTRVISNISEGVFWSLVTPNGGEVIAGD